MAALTQRDDGEPLCWHRVAPETLLLVETSPIDLLRLVLGWEKRAALILMSGLRVRLRVEMQMEECRP